MPGLSCKSPQSFCNYTSTISGSIADFHKGSVSGLQHRDGGVDASQLKKVRCILYINFFSVHIFVPVFVSVHFWLDSMDDSMFFFPFCEFFLSILKDWIWVQCDIMHEIMLYG